MHFISLKNFFNTVAELLPKFARIYCQDYMISKRL